MSASLNASPLLKHSVTRYAEPEGWADAFVLLSSLAACGCAIADPIDVTSIAAVIVATPHPFVIISALPLVTGCDDSAPCATHLLLRREVTTRCATE